MLTKLNVTAVIIALSALLAAPVAAQDAPAEGEEAAAATMQHFPAADVPWTPFNPEEPDGIQIVVLNGDPSAGPSAMLARFPVGFDSGLHSHTAAYTAVAIRGARRHGSNMDDLVELGPGAYWTQPAGEVHVDICDDPEYCISYVEFDGPVDMIPAEAAPEGAGTDSVTATPEFTSLNPEEPTAPEIAMVRGSMEEGSMMVFRVTSENVPHVHSHTSDYTAIVIEGDISRGADDDSLSTVDATGYWTQPGGENHIDYCAEGACLLVVAVHGPFDYIPAAPPAEAPAE